MGEWERGVDEEDREDGEEEGEEVGLPELIWAASGWDHFVLEIGANI